MNTSTWIGVASSVAVVIAFVCLVRHLQDRERRVMEILHRPNETWMLDVVTYLTWGCAAFVVLMIARILFADGEPLMLIACAIVGVLGFKLRQIDKALQNSSDGRLSTSARLRLTVLTHRSLEFMLLMKPHNEPIHVQAEYSRRRSSGAENRDTQSELIWRSPSIALDPVMLLDRSEYRAQIAIPDDFPRPLAPEVAPWRRRWHITIQTSPQQTMNFDFGVPASLPPDA